MKRYFYLICICVFSVSTAWAQRPTTKTAVVRPTTQVSVSRPTTAVAVKRPVTQISVTRPQTQTAIARPETQISVSRPVTQVTVSRPQTIPSQGGTEGNAKASSGGAAGGKAVAVSSSQAKTSMSDYKPPVAKDLKAPSAASTLGGGAGGLGNKTDESAKDAAAAASQAPKALTADDVGSAKALSSSGAVTGSALLNTLNQKAAGREASK